MCVGKITVCAFGVVRVSAFVRRPNRTRPRPRFDGCSSEQPRKGSRFFPGIEFSSAELALSDLNVQKIASLSFENAGPNDFEDENDEGDERRGRS